MQRLSPNLIGQLIPFIIGVASFPSAIWGAVENWQETKLEESHEMKEVCLDVETLKDHNS
jgi:hypothetical protein